MTVRRRCTERNFKHGRRCLEHLRFDLMYRGKRSRIPANEFAIRASSVRSSRWKKRATGNGCSSARSKRGAIL